MSSKVLSLEILAELAALEAMPDEDIDTSDIRELSNEEYNDPTRIRYRGAHNRPLSVIVESKVAHWFKDHATDERPAEAEINRVLLDYVREQQRRAG